MSTSKPPKGYRIARVGEKKTKGYKVYNGSIWVPGEFPGEFVSFVSPPIAVPIKTKNKRRKPRRCVWTYDKNLKYYMASCKSIVARRTPDELHKYCPYCGKLIQVRPYYAGKE